MPDNTSSNNKRIAKNTFALYTRTILTMLVSLYTSRVVLRELGESDFGIYNVVGGLVVLFSFLQGAMSTATQRFLSIELGKQDSSGFNRVFSMSLICHFAIGLIVLILGETIGLWFFETQMNIPSDRHVAALWVYHLSILTCIVNIIRIPYNASIIANEKMQFYAYVGIVEVLMKLSIVYLLVLSKIDKLISYAVLMCLVTIITNIIYQIYCKKKLKGCNMVYFWDKKLFKELIGFSGWSLFGSAANVSANQGVNILMNIFCGVVVNASMGIANQAIHAINTFVTNFQTAFVPQIMKSYAADDKDYFLSLINRTSRYSYLLLFIIGLPIIISCEPILNIWLGEVPEYSVQFTQLMICFCLIDAASGPLWYSVQATGKIRNYQIAVSSIIFLNVPICYVILNAGLSPIYAVVCRVAINFLTHLYRIIYLKHKINLDIPKYCKDTMLRIVIVTIISIPLPMILYAQTKPTTIFAVITYILISLCQTAIMIYIAGIDAAERQLLNNKIKTIICRR